MKTSKQVSTSTHDVDVNWNRCPICGKFILNKIKLCVTCRIKQETGKNNGIIIEEKKKKKRGRPKKQK